ncbi:MAG TPA: ribonuclease H-like domain-containing protein [Bacteroidota bacterium]|nr:ribonuclease H-like domain-containing protein [Bacteroidota bacterium]
MLRSEVYYDVETQLSAEEVGGWQNVHLMRVSVAITWSSVDGFLRWEEKDVPAMIDHLSRFDRIVSFNGDGFDSKVLSSYGSVALINMKSFDVLSDLKAKTGHRLTLESIANATLGAGKSADGLFALRWWKEGKVDLIAEYCKQDVQMLVDIVEFGRDFGYVYYRDREGNPQRINVQW